MRFVDTNVPLYAVSTLPEDADKRLRALELLRQPDLAVSVQVFQEFYHQATRRSRPGRLSHDDALAFLGTLLKFPVQEITLDLFRDARGDQPMFRIVILGRRHSRRGPRHGMRRGLLRRPQRGSGLRRSTGHKPLSGRACGAMTTDTSSLILAALALGR